MMGAPASMGPPAVTPRKAPTTPSHNNFAFGVTPHKTPLRTPGGSKIEQTSSTPIIDFNKIESQKENVQPLAKGRSAHTLSNTLNMQHQQRQALLAQQRADHEAVVTSQDNADSDDPLEAWTKYVKWCIDNYPSGQTHESGLIPLLERATRHFKSSEQYTNDPRYLRLWILYARNVECARDVYNFLLANEIGTKLASLYEELAVVLEGQRMYEEADAMYKLGIARRANPIDRIKRRYEEYKTRIILGQQAVIESSGSGTSAVVSSYTDALRAAMVTAGRSMLGEKEASLGPARSHSANVLRGAGATVSAIGSNSLTPSNNGRKLNVFHDEDDERASRSVSKPGNSTKGWEDIGTVASRNQENIQGDRLAGMTNFKIGASGGVSKKPGSGLAAAVFRDSDDDDDDDQADQVPSTSKPAGVLSPKDHFKPILGRKAHPSETDLLRSNPFAYWGKDAKLVPDPASLRPAAPDAATARKASSYSKTEKHRTKTTVSRSSQPSASTSSTAASTSASGKREKHAAPVAQMYPSFRSSAQKAFYKQRGWASELTLEELTARHYGYASAVEGWEENATPSDPWSRLDKLVGRWLPEPLVEPTATVAIDQTTGMFPLRDVFDPDNSVANAVALNLRPGLKKKKKRDGENTTKVRMSPTLVTKATLLEVESMFNGDSESDDDSSDGGDDDDDSEEDDYVAPLSSVSRAGFMRVELGSAADVPPTPTPLSRSNHLPKLGAQNDENAGVPATPLRTPGTAPKLGLGGATPMRTPLASKSTLPTLGNKPIYREEDEEEDDEAEAAELPAQAQPTEEAADADAPVSPEVESAPLSATVPATPMPSHRQPAARRWIEPMTEEEEEEEAEGEEEYVDENGNPISDLENHDHLFRPQFQPLTPITEATFEFTRYTNARTPGTATRSAKSWRPLTEDDEDEEDEEPSKILTTGPVASRGTEQVAADESQVNSDERSFASTSGEDANHSTWNADNKASFELTKGLTIRCAPEDDEEDGELHERFEDSLVIDEPQRDAEEFSPPNPCSPVDPQILNAILARLSSPLESQPNFVDLTSSSSEDLLSNLQKKCKSTPVANQMTRKSMGGTVFHGTSVLTTPFTARIGRDEYEIRGKLGEGGYGAVFLGFDVNSAATSAVQKVKAEDDDDSDDEDEDDEDRHKQVAIKVESPASQWEFHILSTLASRLPSDVLPSVISARKLYCYSDASFMLLDLREKGTLLDVVNNAASSGVAPSSSSEGAGGVEEILALFFITELLRTILSLHRAGVIHGDLKIDNCLLRLSDVIPSSAWSNIYSRTGSSGWSAKGLTLIDFGRAIDTTAFPSDQKWIADWETDTKDCFEMRAGQPFTYETDWFGLAAVAHCLLFGKYLDTKESAGKHELTASFKRYWQSDLWHSFFDTCLNPHEMDKDQVLEKLDDCLQNMQSWLEANSNKGGKNLKGLLRKLEIWAMKQGH